MYYNSHSIVNILQHIIAFLLYAKESDAMLMTAHDLFLPYFIFSPHLVEDEDKDEFRTVFSM